MKKVVLAVAIASSLIVSGCATGFNAQTNIQGNSGNGRTANEGSIQIRNAVIVVDEKNPTSASLVATVINTASKADSLKSLEVDPAITVTATELELKSNQAVSIGYNSAVAIAFNATEATLMPGRFIDVNFIFENNKSIKMSLLVVLNNEFYSDVVVPSLTPSASPTPSAS